MTKFKEKIKAKALGLGFDDVGFCGAQPFDDWQEQAYDAIKRVMSYDPRTIMADAQSIIVAVKRYRSYAAWPGGAAEVSHYYTNSSIGFADIKLLAKILVDEGFKAAPSPRLPAKRAALRTGMGCQGMNTQFCHDELGVLVSIHLILTDAPLSNQFEERTECSGCRLCLEACPTGAITKDFGFDYLMCLRHHMISGKPAPQSYRNAMGTQLLGCTLCQEACPNAKIERIEIPMDLLAACGIDGLLAGDASQLEVLERYVGTNFVKPNKILAQAAICAGNSGNATYVPRLAALLVHDNVTVRSHSAWALGMLGGEHAYAALSQARANETDVDVLNEINAALTI